MTLLEKLQKLDPEKEVILIAIDRLQEPQKIVQFFDELVILYQERIEEGQIRLSEYYKELSDQEKAIRLARSVIGSALSNYKKEVQTRWFETLSMKDWYLPPS